MGFKNVLFFRFLADGGGKNVRAEQATQQPPAEQQSTTDSNRQGGTSSKRGSATDLMLSAKSGQVY